MAQEYRNIYQIAREATGLTQEKAAELIDVSVESIRAYETDRRIPPDKVVIKMIEIYGCQYLAYQHLKTSAEVGQKCMPNVEIKDLPTAILRLQKEVSDFIKCRDEMVDITCDGIISEEERPRYDSIIAELDDIMSAIMSVKFAK